MAWCTRWRRAVMLSLLCGGLLAAPATASASQTLTAEAYRQQIAAANTLVQQCAAAAAACAGAKAPEGGQVMAEGGRAGFTADWEWLAQLLEEAHGAKPTERAEAMAAAGAHLQELLAETQSASGTMEQRSAVRASAIVDQVLSEPEFREAEAPPSWWDRAVARVQDWLFRLLGGVGRVGSRHPWLAPAIEWSCFVLAAGGLLFFVRRSLQRQSLRIAWSGDLQQSQGRERDAAAWAEMAEARAAESNWREAVHCLYWAAIVTMEGRRAWRPNPTRTPREYVRLLRAGSEAQRALRELTGALERLWYGHGEATEAAFRDAKTAYRALMSADLRGETSQAPRSTSELRPAPGAA